MSRLNASDRDIFDIFVYTDSIRSRLFSILVQDCSFSIAEIVYPSFMGVSNFGGVSSQAAVCSEWQERLQEMPQERLDVSPPVTPPVSPPRKPSANLLTLSLMLYVRLSLEN